MHKLYFTETLSYNNQTYISLSSIVYVTHLIQMTIVATLASIGAICPPPTMWPK